MLRHIARLLQGPADIDRVGGVQVASPFVLTYDDAVGAV